ncbi:MAG: hypothetical protein PHP44_14975 [Kiritimatiellae bacterium]|nr:hypothetical protein [Kiritimatiellia bacterium]
MKNENQTLTEKAVEAMRASVRTVRDEHRRRNRPLATWEDGKVVYRDADSGQTVHEDSVPYRTKSE